MTHPERSTPTSGDEWRGQAAVIGFVLMFGLVMLLVTVLQVTAVPAWNQGVEYDHNQQVRSELELLRDDVAEAAATGRVTSESITLGTRYPRRPFLLNPGNPTGSLRTTAEGTVRLTNLTATGEAGDYWTNDTRAFSTRHLVYEPNYNEYKSAPTTVYENGLLYDRYGERTLPRTAERVVNGDRITLVMVDGSLSRASTRPVSVELTPVSAPHEVTTVRGDGPVRIELPTRLDKETWDGLLEDQFVDNGGNVYDNVTVSEGDPHDTVTISLRGNQTYSLRLAKVSIQTRPQKATAHYITVESSDRVRLSPGDTERVTVAVRDRYNNPVSGVPVDADPANGLGSVEPVDSVTDTDGLATFRYVANESGTEPIEATFGDGTTLETATVTVDVTAAGGGADPAGPLVTEVTTNRTTETVRTVQQGDSLTLSADASDFERGGTDVYAAEWWSNRTAPGGDAGTGFSMAAADGTFDAVDEQVVASGIDTTGWAVGKHTISVRAQDGDGDWGPTATYVVEIVEQSETPAGESATYVEGTATSTKSRNRFSFSLDTGGASVTLRNASIDTRPLDGGQRRGWNDVKVDGDSVYKDDYTSDGTVLPFADTTVEGESTIRFGQLKSGEKLPDGPYTFQSEEPGEPNYLVVTLGFADGSQTRLYFVPA